MAHDDGQTIEQYWMIYMKEENNLLKNAWNVKRDWPRKLSYVVVVDAGLSDPRWRKTPDDGIISQIQSYTKYLTWLYNCSDVKLVQMSGGKGSNVK